LPTIARPRLGLPRLTGLWRHPDFMKLWTAETISQFGTQVSFLAIPLVAAVILKVSPAEFALLAVFDFLPFILFTLPAGAWVDRLRRRPVMIVGDVGRAVMLLSIPVAYELGVLTIYQLYVVGFVNGILTVFFDVAYQSYLPSLVERDQIVEGNAKLEISRSTAYIAGPGVGGVLVQVVGAALAVIADAISFLGSALFLFAIRKREPPPVRQQTAEGKDVGLRTEVAEGLRYVIGNKYLRPIAACTGTSNLFGTIGFSIFLLYMARDLGLEAGLIGLIFGLGNIGTLVGAFTASTVPKYLGVGRTIVGSALLFGPTALLMPLATRETAVPLLVTSGLIAGFGNVLYNVNQVSLRQAITPERMQGRMNATMRFIVWGTIPIGGILGGILGTTLGLLPTLWISAIFSFIPGLFVLFSPVRNLKSIPEPESDDEAGDEPARNVEERTTLMPGPGPLPTGDER
jgi:MFS family permease